MNKNLDQIEAQLRLLFEKRFLQLFTGGDQQELSSIIEKLIQTMRDNLQTDELGKTHAPDRFFLHVNPEEYAEWHARQDILDEMAATIHKTGINEGFVFHHTPTIKIQINPEISENQLLISAFFNTEEPPLTDTASMTQPDNQSHPESLPNNAYLVIGGSTNFPLNKPIINIGRHSENDLVLDDPHSSRHHAQLRVINNQYVIFDVGSTGGILLNGKEIIQTTLQAGDVIRIGMTNLIYIQDTTSANPTTAIPIDEDNLTKSEDI